MIVLGIDTSTSQTSVALGTERGMLASLEFAGPTRRDQVVPGLEHLLSWSGLELSQVGGVAVGLGPGLFTGLRVGVETAKTLAQVLGAPILGMGSLDALAFRVRHTGRLVGAVIDARRGEVFYAFYRPVPGGVMREGDHQVGPPEHLAADLQASGEDVLLVGNGAILYRQGLEGGGGGIEFASPGEAHPQASALVELAIPRFLREEQDRLTELAPLYLRRSDAEIAWDQRRRGASA